MGRMKNTISKTFPELYQKWGADSEISKFARHILKFQNQEGKSRNVSESASQILKFQNLRRICCTNFKFEFKTN